MISIKIRQLFSIVEVTLISTFLYITYNSFYSLLIPQEEISHKDIASLLFSLSVKALLYAIFYLGGGFIFFYTLLGISAVPIPKKKRLLHSILFGLFGGFVCFGFVFIFTHYNANLFTDLKLKTDKINIVIEIQHGGLAFLICHLFFSAFLSAIMEEIYYRHYLQKYLREKIGVLASILISSSIFSLVHGDAAMIIFPISFIFCILYWQYGLSSSIMAHLIYNALILLKVSKI